ncbi:tripartite tricarboxylate transporter substrate binding protein [Bosea sp. 117]|uniref:Bug family tripartite tricarboxylate transporter substrate binding protein n=1 Tax=Bosea sp. 117 TaxID=1125973 RepID=UPI000494A65F|nr:tripartite tricarboxylate transporter substrate binding protein [Bosea sp. 117]
MKAFLSRRAALVLAGAAFTLSLAPASAEEIDVSKYPQGTVRIVVTSSAGASADALARTVARELGKIWGKDPVVENVPGSNGNIGLEQVANSKPDGLTIAVGGDKVPLNAIFYGPELKTDLIKDLSTVTKAVANPQIIVVRPSLGVKNLDEYLKLAKEKDGALTVGTPSNGGAHHIGHLLLGEKTNTKYTFIPYKGGAPAVTDLLGGHIDAVIITLAAVTEHVRAGRLVAIGVSTAARSPALPDVPTFQEQGIKDFDVSTWQGFHVSAKTPRPLVEKINRDFVKALTAPEVKSFLEGQGFSVVASTAEQGDATVRSDFERYGAVIKAANIKLD